MRKLREYNYPSEIEYLAIPYSHDDESIRNFRANISDIIWADLCNNNRIIFAPISSCHHIATKYNMPKTWDFWKRIDEEFVKCSKRLLVVTLDGWETSTGVTAEIEIAIENNIPIEYIDPIPYIDKLINESSKITFDDYQTRCSLTDVGTSAQDVLSPGWLYYVLGITGECGELMEKIKKLFRDKKGIIDDEFKEMVIKESGDILWYMGRLLSQFNISFGDVAQTNITKLMSRMERGKLHGDGDNR